MTLELRNISKSFGKKQVLKNISLKAESGKTFGLLGRNGAGKTTAIRILMNVFPADGGEIFLDGSPVDYSKLSFGYLPEERGLYQKKKIADQLIYFAELKGLRHKEAAKQVMLWLERLGAAQLADKRLNTLSKGNQQKIQLISALAHNPDIIVLDEPFSGLDPVNAQLLKNIVKEETEKGKIVFFSSHQMNYIEEFCDSIAILNGGRIVLSGKLREIKRNYPRDRLVVFSEQSEDISAVFPDSVIDGDSGALMIPLHSPDEKQRVMQRLTEGFDIDEVKVFEPSLGDIFVEYAGKRK